MSLKPALVILVLLVSVVSLAGCTGPSPAMAATLTPVPAATTVPAPPAPAGTAPVAATTPVSTVPDTPGTQRYSRTYTFEGTGDGTKTFTTTSDRTWVFRMSSPAKEIFLVTLQDGNGDTVDVLADASDVFAGTESVTLNAGTWYLDVEADAPWTITVSTE